MDLPDDRQLHIDLALLIKYYWAPLTDEQQQDCWLRLVAKRREQGHDWPDEVLDWPKVKAEFKRRQGWGQPARPGIVRRVGRWIVAAISPS